MEKKYTKEELDDIERRKYKDEDEKATLIPKLRYVQHVLGGLGISKGLFAV